MGQQQLLLLVLGIVIVGLAVVVGIQAFDDSNQQSQIDAITMDMVKILSDVKAWGAKPEAFGGGGGDYQYDDNGTATNVTFAQLGYDSNSIDVDGKYTNANGLYTLGGAFDLSGALTLTAAHPSGTGNIVASLSATGDITVAQ